MADYEVYLVSSLEKVFPTHRPTPMEAGQRLSVWRGARASVQMAYYARINAPLLEMLPTFTVQASGGPAIARMRTVELVPSDYPSYARARADDNYLTHEPGLLPDLLRPLESPRITPIPGQYRSLWLSWDIPGTALPGEYEISIDVRAEEEMLSPMGTLCRNPLAEEQRFHLSFIVHVRAAELPRQELIHTEWFHADCLASYYQVEPLGETHWNIMDHFIASAAEHGVNMLLTPVFTPPLDTWVGGERPTVQLVQVTLQGDAYTFDFSALSRWVGLCKKHRIRYLEIAHLFTQWGAKATPKIMATVNGVSKRLFGWDVPAASREYRAFLEAFLPALRAHLAAEGYDRQHVFFHVSDEPAEAHLEEYRAARLQVQDLLAGCPVIDALSSLTFYQKGLVDHPIPAVNHLRAFLDAKVSDLWTYYCCDQSVSSPNRFCAMPSARSRIMGVLLYLYDIKGFLHWGFNFYYSQFSRHLIDPFRVTHAGYAFPTGDPYLVYPGPEGYPLSSIRAEVQDDALLDLRALRLLERVAGRNAVEALIRKTAGRQPITFESYPRDAGFLLALRENVAAAIESKTTHDI
ncbi:MAG: DUF4091 domain-containing protein [Candidatus Limiplasma sp.]|nr:DUF4091 domain-containing protein [Candidatus Limiplasma sp.]